MTVTDILGDAGAQESITPGNAATGLTESKRVPTTGACANLTAKGALITVEDNAARFCLDGTTPTNANGSSADTGTKIGAGDNIELRSQNNLNNFLIIDAVNGSASVIKVIYYF